MKKEYRIGLVVGVIVIIFGTFAFFQNTSQKESGLSQEYPEKIKIVTTLYPYEYLAQQIAGENAEVVNVVSGVEPHDFEPTIGDIKMMMDADVVIINGAGLDSWAEKVIPELEKENVQVLVASNMTELLPFEEHHEEEEAHEEEEHEHGALDPHIWLSFKNLLKVTAGIQETLGRVDAEHQALYVKNGEALQARIRDWDTQYAQGLQSCKVRTVVTGHEAFAYLAHDYNFTIEGITGISPEQEVTPKRLQEIGNLLRGMNSKTVLVEENTPSQVREVLEKDFQVAVLPLYPLEYRSSAILEAGKDYEDLVVTNLANLSRAMECQK